MTASPHPSPRSPFPYRVVVADDDPDMRTVLQRHLTARGCVVEAFASGREVIGRLDAGARYHFACLDVRMAGHDGPATLERIRRRPFPVCRTPVLMITGAGDEDSVTRCIDAGANGILLKPFDAAALARYVDAVIAPPLDEQELRDVVAALGVNDEAVAARGPRLGLRAGLLGFSRAIIRPGADVATSVHVFVDPGVHGRGLDRRPLDVLRTKVMVVTAGATPVVLWPDPGVPVGR